MTKLVLPAPTPTYDSRAESQRNLLIEQAVSRAGNSGSASVAWGGITGTLSAQTDLQTALDAKQPVDAQLTSLATLVYTGNALRTVRVNAAETGFELAPAGGGVPDFLLFAAGIK